jgi:hypothetical protein
MNLCTTVILAQVLCKQASIHFQFEEDALCFTNTLKFGEKHKYDSPKMRPLCIQGVIEKLREDDPIYQGNNPYHARQPNQTCVQNGS